MPGFIVHQNATVMCTHAGTGTPTTVDTRVKVSGMGVVTQPFPYNIAGCSLASIPTTPCIVGQWVSAATRVLVSGQPVVLMDSQGVCPPGTMMVISAQTRVSAT